MDNSNQPTPITPEQTPPQSPTPTVLSTPKKHGLKRVATVLLILLFFMPLIGTFMLSAGQSAETKQYDSLQWLVMGVYNIPFFLASLITLLVGSSFQNKSKEKASRVLLLVSIASSIIGSLLMLTWGLH